MPRNSDFLPITLRVISQGETSLIKSMGGCDKEAAEVSPEKRGIGALIGCSVAIFWPASFIFGLPGVMGPYWQTTLQVERGAIGNILYFVLAAVGLFMFSVGSW